MNLRPREDWQDPAMPVVGPPIKLAAVELVPAHYTAAPDVPDDDIPGYLRAIQTDYTINRGYSIGYNFAVDKTGTVWECRGFDIKCAANKDMNDVTIAVLCLVDGADPLSPPMVDAFRQLGGEAQRVVGRGLLVVGHRDIGSTACPGDGIYHQVQTGQLDPAGAVDPPPQPIPPPQPVGDDDMPFLIINRDTGEPAIVYGDGKVTGVHPPDLPSWEAAFGSALAVPAPVFDDFADKGRD